MWRSVIAKSEQNEYIFLCQLNEGRDKWNAWLVLTGEDELGSLIARFEYHGSHPGFHFHGHCERGGIERGPSSLNELVRIPKASSGGMTMTLRRDNFWEQARRRFRIAFPEGTLL